MAMVKGNVSFDIPHQAHKYQFVIDSQYQYNIEIPT